MKRIVIPFGLVMLFAGLLALYYVFRTPSEIRDQTADFRLTAAELVNAFAEDEEKATKEYVEKIIEVTGKVLSIETNGDDVSAVLQSGDPLSNITCSFRVTERNVIDGLAIGKNTTIKGLCAGKLIDVVLTQCSVVVE